MAAWIARQGQVGDLRGKNKDELLEILSRQEKLLSNRKFIQTLPDKGKKIADFTEKVRLVLGRLEEEERKQERLISSETGFQSQYQQAFGLRNPEIPSDSHLNVFIPSNSRPEDFLTQFNTEKSLSTPSKNETPDTVNKNFQDLLLEDARLVEGFAGVTLAESSDTSRKDPFKSSTSKNPFLSDQQHTTLPHYLEVLEKTEKSLKKPRFKLNQLVVKSESSSHQSHRDVILKSSSLLSSGGATPPTVEARKQRERKHLDDITAAKLLPLHHSPALLLTLEESAVLLQEQTRKYQELQAKQAAQKLADGLSTRMESFNPEGGSLATYREVRDDGAQLSSEED